MSDVYKQTWLEFIDGKQDAMLNIYEQHYLGLTNFGVKVSGDRLLTKECITEMLIGLWDKKDTLPAVDNVRAYLFTCLKRTIFHHYRAEKIRLTKEDIFTSEVNDEFNLDDYISNIQSNVVLRSKMLKIMEVLSPRQTELIQLRFFADLDYDEIAERCAITKRTAYNIINSGLKILKAELQNHPDMNPGGDFYTVLLLCLLVANIESNSSLFSHLFSNFQKTLN